MPNTITRSKSTRTQDLASLRAKIKDMSNPRGAQKSDDDRLWKPELDKTGTGSAVIRFLPALVEEAFPFIQIYTHGFQGPTGKWFIENCPTSISEDCPVCTANSELWNTGVEAKKKLASSRKRRLGYVSNILVVNDPKHPENNDKVFLYRYGAKIFGKITDMVNPPEAFADMASVVPYDMEEGANFKLRVVKQDGFPNYDKSSFDNPTPVGNEDRIAELETQLYSLTELLDPKHFKSFDDLKKKFDQATSGPANNEDENSAGDSTNSVEDSAPVAKPRAGKAVAAKTGKTAGPKASTAVAGADDDDDYFSKLAERQTQTT